MNIYFVKSKKISFIFMYFMYSNKYLQLYYFKFKNSIDKNICFLENNKINMLIVSTNIVVFILVIYLRIDREVWSNNF